MIYNKGYCVNFQKNISSENYLVGLENVLKKALRTYTIVAVTN